jgi:glycosyltransferase involved in cell wall biosynthesis
VPSAAIVIAAMSLAIWIYLVFASGWFWRLGEFDHDKTEFQPPREWPCVIAVVPALARQDDPGEFEIVVVDDHSEDDTAEITRHAAGECGAPERFSICSAAPLPVGWTGKLWALNEGVTQAAKNAPEFYWFTDADVAHAPETLRQLVAEAEAGNLDLASLMVLLQAKSLPERALFGTLAGMFLTYIIPVAVLATHDSAARVLGAAA